MHTRAPIQHRRDRARATAGTLPGPSAFRWLLGAALMLAALALSQAALAASEATTGFGRVTNSWPEAGLSLSLDSAPGEALVLVGDPLRYRIASRAAGQCYLVHIDSRGAASVMRPAECRAGDDGQVRSAFPTRGALTAAQPLGEETVIAILSAEPLAPMDRLLEGTGGFAALEDAAAIDALVAELNAAAGTMPVATAQLSYRVDTAPEKVQYTTRGIIRKVKEARDSDREALDGVIATFDVQAIQFDFNSADLTSEGILQLEAFAAALQSDDLADVRLKVSGHTDQIGDEIYNDDLSLRRANAVREYIETNYDVAPGRIEVLGFGERKPLVEGSDPESLARNRRVEMMFLDP